MKKKDANVEILRTLACILVVLVHVNDLPLIEFDKSILEFCNFSKQKETENFTIYTLNKEYLDKVLEKRH